MVVPSLVVMVFMRRSPSTWGTGTLGPSRRPARPDRTGVAAGAQAFRSRENLVAAGGGSTVLAERVLELGSRAGQVVTGLNEREPGTHVVEQRISQLDDRANTGSVPARGQVPLGGRRGDQRAGRGHRLEGRSQAG